MLLEALYFQQWPAEDSIAPRLLWEGRLVHLGNCGCAGGFPVLWTLVAGMGVSGWCVREQEITVSILLGAFLCLVLLHGLLRSCYAHFHLRSRACSPKEQLISEGRIFCLCGVFLLKVSPDLFILPCWGISVFYISYSLISTPLHPASRGRSCFPLYLSKVTATPRLWTKHQHVCLIHPVCLSAGGQLY